MKITVIGGGSYAWAFGFARQFVDSKHLKNIHLTLMDINAEALDLVGRAARLYNQTQGAPITIETTPHADAALDGADFVLVTITTGGFEAMSHDLKIPEKYGIWHTVGDTVGPGGWARAARNIPVFHDLGARMKKVCPNAWLLNFTNPLTVLTRVPGREFGIKAIGMCPGVEEQARALAALAGHQRDSRFDYVVTGIDHGSYFTKLHADGADVLEKLKKMGFFRSDGKLPSEVQTQDRMISGINPNSAVFALWREIGHMPSTSDRHQVENFPWFIVNDHGVLPFGIRRTSIEARQSMNRQHRTRLEQYVSGKDESIFQNLVHGNDPALEVIESLCGHRSFLWGANYKNEGQIPEAPLDAVVETRCRFDAAGVHPFASPMPDVLKALVLPHVCRQEAMIDVALTGSFDEFVALVATDPLCCRLPMGQCREMMRELLAANRQHIQNRRLLEY